MSFTLVFFFLRRRVFRPAEWIMNLFSKEIFAKKKEREILLIKMNRQPKEKEILMRCVQAS